MLWFPILGQSNSWGHGTTARPLADAGYYRLDLAGRLVTLSSGGNLRANSDTNDIYGENPGDEGTYTLEGGLVTSLRAGGITDDIGTILLGKDGTGSASAWNVDTTTEPIDTVTTNLIERAKSYIWDAMDHTSASLGAIIIYQGESNATGDVTDTPAVWITDWDAILDELAATFTFAGTKKFVVVQLPPTEPTDLSFPNWSTVRTNQNTLVNTTRSADADSVLVTADESVTVTGEDYHLESAALEITGDSIGDSIIANFGLV